VTPVTPALHPELAALEFLVATWAGSGEGSYPGSSAFTFEEELTFSHEGKPVLGYLMRTSLSGGNVPAHAERGFWRCSNSDELDSVVAHATGHVEVSVGRIEANSVTLESNNVIGWRGAKEVLTIWRRLSLDGDVLTDALGMGAVGHELQAHVHAELRRR
jgi:hypothetical protein